MYFSDKLILRDISVTSDSSGYQVETYNDVEVWTDKKSVTRSEFYAANANGINISVVFTVHDEDYKGQTDVVHDGKSYQVIRAYQKGYGTIELMCSDKAE